MSSVTLPLKVAIEALGTSAEELKASGATVTGKTVSLDPGSSNPLIRRAIELARMASPGNAYYSSNDGMQPRNVMVLQFRGLPGVAQAEEVRVTGLSPQGEKVLNRMRPLQRFADFINGLSPRYVPAIAIGSLVSVAGLLTLTTPLTWGMSLLAGGAVLLVGTGVLRVAAMLGQAERVGVANRQG